MRFARAKISADVEKQWATIIDGIADAIASSRSLELTPELKRDLRYAVEFAYQAGCRRTRTPIRGRAPDEVDLLLDELAELDRRTGRAAH